MNKLSHTHYDAKQVLGYTVRVAKKYSSEYLFSEDELQSIGNLAYAVTLNKFKPELGFQFSTYLWYSIRSCLLQELQFKNKYKSTPLCEKIPAPPVEPSYNVDLQSIFKFLDKRCRTIVKMRMQGFLYREIGEKLGVSQTRVKQLIVESREKLLEEGLLNEYI